jgi:tape measure domain-containing protein
MASNVATLQAKLVADTSQFLRELKRAQGALGGVGRGFKLLSMAAAPLRMVGGLLGKVAGGLLRIGQIAAGILLAELFRKGAQAIQWFLRTAMDATEVMQRLNIQIQTLAARELSKSIDASLNQAITWRKMGQEGETVVFNIEKLREAVDQYGDVILDVNPELEALINSNQKFGSVSIDVAKKWMSTSDVFEQSQATARDFINQLKKIAIISPFTVATTNTMFRLASALGFTQQQAVTITKGMLDVAAGLGLTEEAAQRLVLNFSQIRSQGKLTQRDIREMSLTGFQMTDVFDEMNRTLGTTIKTNEDFNKALKSGQFTWEEFVDSFANMADREFGESAERMAFTIGGLKSTFKDVFLTTIPEILMPTATLFGEFAKDAVDKLMQLVESGDLERIGEELKAKVEIWLNHISTFLLRLDQSGLSTALEGLAQAGGLPPIIAASFRGLGSALDTVSGLKDIVDLLGQIRGGSFDAFGREQLEGVGEGPLPVTAVDVESIMPEGSALVGPIDSILEIWQKLRDWWDQNGGAITMAVQTLGAALGSILKAAAEQLVPPLQELFEALKVYIDKFPWDLLLQFLGALAAILGGVLFMAFAGLIGVVKGLLQFFSVLTTTVAEVFETLAQSFQAVVAFLTGEISFEELVTTLISNIIEVIGTAGTGVLEAFVGLFTGVFDGVAGVFNGLAEFLGAEQLPMLGDTIREGFGAVMDDLKVKFKTWTADLFASGKAMVDGLWAGMKSVWGRFTAWIDQQIAKIPKAIRDFLGIHSPSSVMIDIGTNIISGLTAGIGSEDPAERIPRNFDLKALNTSLFTRMSAATGGGGGAKQTGATGLNQIVSQITSATGLATITATDAQVEAQAQSSAMLAQVQQSNTGQQLASEAQTRTALASKLDEVIMALQAQGNAAQTANAIVEGLQVADF